MENYRDLLIALYTEHAPENLATVDYYLEKYQGKEKQYYITQKAKYANKKSVTDSKKILEGAMARIAEKKAAQAKALAESMADVKVPEEKPVIAEQVIEKPVEKPVVEVISPAPVEVVEEIMPEIKSPEPDHVVHGFVRPPIDEEPVAAPQEIEIETEKTEIQEEEPIMDASSTPQFFMEKEDPKDGFFYETKIENEPVAPKPEPVEQSKPQIPPIAPVETNPFAPAKGKLQKKEPTIFWYFGGAALVILLVAAAIYHFHFSNIGNTQKEAEQVHVETIVVEEPSTTTETVVVDATVNDTTKVAGEMSSQTTTTTTTSTEVTIAETSTSVTTTPAVVEEKKAEEPVVEKPAVETAPKSTVTSQPTADRLYNSDVTRPAYFVGCFSVETEELAQKKVEEIKKLGLAGHYYWQPELDPSGKAFFKVVVGPFATQREAYPSLTKVQEHINFDAYILPLK